MLQTVVLLQQGNWIIKKNCKSIYLFLQASEIHCFNKIFVHAQAGNLVRTPVFFHYILMLDYLYLHAIFKS